MQATQNDADFGATYPLRILIAEDVEISRRLLILMLRKLGYQADAVANGRECYKAVLEGQYDLLLTDIDMPEMNGIECARALRLAGVELPIIAVTAGAFGVARDECIAAGMADYIQKPVEVPELKRALREVALRQWLQMANQAVAGI